MRNAARSAAGRARRFWRACAETLAGSPGLQVVALALATRLLLYLLAYLAARLFQNRGDGFFQIFAELWQRSDAPHYLDIAEEWYVNAGEDRVFLVFLPLYPLLVRALSFFFGGDTLFAGIALSLGAFAAAAAVIYKTAPLVCRDAPCGGERLGAADRYGASADADAGGSESAGDGWDEVAASCHGASGGVSDCASRGLGAADRYGASASAGAGGAPVHAPREPGAPDPFLSAKYLICFPASFFVNGTFTESLFLLLSALFFYFMLRRRWAACGLMAMLAALTRYYGALLAIPLAIELALDAAREWRSAPRSGMAGLPRFLAASGFARRAAAVLMAPLGTGLYLLLNYAVSGNAFQFLVYQREHWNQTFGLFYENVGSLAANMLQWQPSDSAAIFAPQLAMAAFGIAILIYGIAKKFRVSMLAYLAAYFLISVSASWMLSLPRYIFGAAPVYWLLAEAGGHRLADALITFALVCGLVYYMLAYVSGYHVY
ncbi:MAG: hypothetical protein LBL83_08495 [Clostridiales bacterium]|nr:hypothetical protein [Clostridiales bacterium]